ncbi:hypothetical protein [Vibrio sp. F74]|uniref:hypothetical protein n=1 Tax=Vibrio sp. F74 TaxID=700020 RepID=UPI0035F56485
MNFINSSMYTLAQTLAKMFVGFVIIKLIAVTSGPVGVSNFGFFQNISLIYVMLCGGLAVTGVTKVISESPIRTKNIFCKFNSIGQFTYNASIYGTLSVGALLGGYFLLSEQYSIDTILYFSLGLFFVFFQSKVLIFNAVLNGFYQIKQLAQVNIWASIISLSFALCTYYYYPKWQLLSISIPLGYFVVYFFTEKKNIRFYRNKKLNIDLGSSLIIKKYAFFGLVSAISLPLCQITIRNYLSVSYSAHDAGIWQGLIRFSEVYLVFVSSALSVYLVPKISSSRCKNEIINIVKKVFSATVLVSVLGILLVYLFRNTIITVLFDESFLEMSELFIYQLPGDFFKILSWVIAFSLLGMGGVKIMIILEIIFSVTYVTMSLFLLDTYGLLGAIIAYTINYGIYLLAILIMFGVKVGKYETLS